MAQSITVPTRLYFEDILPRTGWGLYFNFMIAMACIASFTHATAFFALPFSIALSTCEHRITEEIILTVHASFVLGRIFGGLLINPLCDIYGRKRLITHTMLIIFLSTFMCAFAYSYYVIVLSAVVLASGLFTSIRLYTSIVIVIIANIHRNVTTIRGPFRGSHRPCSKGNM
ncbi:hypothetical protein NQ315_002735 [Exocentrus adspersus]|uniref:Major facilitator superfamily (MFS) profile domain-containing protein n=1 Tax=Exocentrus adspersus TaxID=1586481 RepID=A0AAV8V8S0_9CUCU|nr:hypothetical protein NQ315_002735 [Exocentrus adspersus]